MSEWTYKIDEFGALSFAKNGRKSSGVCANPSIIVSYNVKMSMIFAADQLKGKLESDEDGNTSFVKCAIDALSDLASFNTWTYKVDENGALTFEKKHRTDGVNGKWDVGVMSEKTIQSLISAAELVMMKLENDDEDAESFAKCAIYGMRAAVMHKRNYDHHHIITGCV